VAYVVREMAWPLQNIQPVGTTSPPYMRSSPMNGGE
jgi:hypothetical protein